MRHPVPAPIPKCRGDLDGCRVYLEPSEDSAPCNPTDDVFPTHAAGYAAVLAAREATASLGRIFDLRGV